MNAYYVPSPVDRIIALKKLTMQEQAGGGGEIISKQEIYRNLQQLYRKIRTWLIQDKAQIS